MEKVLDFTVTRFDGEGVISKQLAKKIDKQYCGKHIHSSFQIRMPFVKGMVHKVDFKDFLKSGGCDTITDIFGVQHPVDEVEMILTKSMFKGYGWLTENGKSWEDYLSAFRKYDHALYITNVNKPKTEAYTTLNYHAVHDGGGIPSPGSAGGLGAQPGSGTQELDHKGHRAAVFRSVCRSRWENSVLYRAGHPAGAGRQEESAAGAGALLRQGTVRRGGPRSAGI